MRPVLALALVIGVALAGGPALAIGGAGGPAAAKNNPYAQAVKLIKAGNYAQAVPLLEKTVKANPTNADAYNYLGFSHRKLGDLEAAFDNYRRALDIDPEHRGANEYLGELYLELGELQKAEERLEVLNGACFFGCEEYDELKEAIAAYKAKAGR